jgi:hypothetical protein
MLSFPLIHLHCEPYPHILPPSEEPIGYTRVYFCANGSIFPSLESLRGEIRNCWTNVFFHSWKKIKIGRGFWQTLEDALSPIHLIARTLVKFNQIYSVIECSELLHKLCSINSTVKQLHKKLEFLDHRLGALTTSHFFLILWSCTCLSKNK